MSIMSVLFKHYRKWLPVGKSSCRDLLQWASHSFDNRTIVGRESMAQTIKGILPYIRNRLLPTWGGVGGCDLHLCHGVNEVNVDAGNMYLDLRAIGASQAGQAIVWPLFGRSLGKGRQSPSCACTIGVYSAFLDCYKWFYSSPAALSLLQAMSLTITYLPSTALPVYVN